MSEELKITVVGASDRSPPGTLDKIERFATIFSLVAIPIIVAYVGNKIEGAIETANINATLDKDYTQISLDLLTTTSNEEEELEPANRALRTWAVKVLNEHSPKHKIEGEARDLLIAGRLKLPKPIATPPPPTPTVVEQSAASDVYVANGWVYFGKLEADKWRDSNIQGLSGLPSEGSFYRTGSEVYVRDDHPNPKLAPITGGAPEGVWLRVEQVRPTPKTGSVWCRVRVMDKRFQAKPTEDTA